MRVIDAGHEFQLGTLDGHELMTLKFVKRMGPLYPGNCTSHVGTTSQEVLRALISRAEYVNAQDWCWQTAVSIKLMCWVVWLYEYRAARRHGRKIPSVGEAVWGFCCYHCGHVECEGRCQ